MKAWIVSNDEEDLACVVFHDHGLAARRIGSEEIDTEFDYTECIREKKYDKYSDKGYVPIEILIRDGWHFECYNCHKWVDKYVEASVFPGSSVYCSEQCHKNRLEYIARINKEYYEFQVSMVNAWCKWDIVGFRGGFPILTPSAFFAVPGAKHRGKLTIINGKLACFGGT